MEYGKGKSDAGTTLKYHLILTLDYELFGDGSGCLDACVVRPTEACRSIVEAHGGHLTLFVEALEFAAIARAGGDRVVEHYSAVERQLSSLARTGHALELHLHPQWLDASCASTGWNLDFRKWRVGDLADEEIHRCFDEGIGYLNRFSRSPVAFRAGGWTIQPAGRVLRELEARHLKIDSTVAPGVHNAASGDWYDFRRAAIAPFWRVADDVLWPEQNGAIIEIPITTARLGRYAHFKALKESKSQDEFPESCQGSYAGPNDRLQWFKGRISRLQGLGRAMLDFSTLPAWALIDVTRRYMALQEHAAQSPIPIVAIGHNKNFSARSRAALTEYLQWVARTPEITFSDYDTWLEAVQLNSSR